MQSGQYVFIGGPMDMQTRFTGGEYWIDCAEQMKPIKATEVYANPILDTDVTFKAHRYVLTDVSIIGVVRRFYVSQSLSVTEVNKKIGLFLASLMDIYVES